MRIISEHYKIATILSRNHLLVKTLLILSSYAAINAIIPAPIKNPTFCQTKFTICLGPRSSASSIVSGNYGREFQMELKALRYACGHRSIHVGVAKCVCVAMCVCMAMYCMYGYVLYVWLCTVCMAMYSMYGYVQYVCMNVPNYST